MSFVQRNPKPVGLKQDCDGRFYLLQHYPPPEDEVTIPVQPKPYTFKLLHTFHVDSAGVSTVEKCERVGCFVCGGPDENS